MHRFLKVRQAEQGLCIITVYTGALSRWELCEMQTHSYLFPRYTGGPEGRWWAYFVRQEAINLECVAPGAPRLDLNGAQPATETRLNCLIDWLRLQGIFLKPLCADQ